MTCFSPKCQQWGNEQKQEENSFCLLSSVCSRSFLPFLGFRTGTGSSIHGDLDVGTGTCRARDTRCLHRGREPPMVSPLGFRAPLPSGQFPPGFTASLLTSGTFCHQEVWLVETGCGHSLWNSCLCLTFVYKRQGGKGRPLGESFDRGELFCYTEYPDEKGPWVNHVGDWVFCAPKTFG